MRPDRFRFRRELISDKAATKQLRIEARADLEQAIKFAEICVRLARTPEEHEHDTLEIEKLKAQREPEVRHVRIGRGAR
jgi:hypothetical protein